MQYALLEKGMATSYSILAWRIPWPEEPGGEQSMGHKESDRKRIPILQTGQLFYHRTLRFPQKIFEGNVIQSPVRLRVRGIFVIFREGVISSYISVLYLLYHSQMEIIVIQWYRKNMASSNHSLEIGGSTNGNQGVYSR